MGNLSFYIRKAWRDFVDPIQFGVSDCYPHHSDWPYALDYSARGMVDLYEMKRDEDGIVMMPHYVDHLGSTRDTETHYYSPLKVAHYALGVYNDQVGSDGKRSWESFFDHVHYLTDNYTHFEDNPDQVIWRTPTSVARYGVEVDHTSAIVQGLVISALVRAYLITRDSRYLDLSGRALGVLDVPVRDGGVSADTQWGVMYEEYPSEPYSHVINGFIFCLIGLFELSAVGGSQRAQRLFDQGVHTLAEVLPLWVDNWWSKYDLRDLTNDETPNYATMHYQYLHRDQLEVIWKITNAEIFYSYFEKLNRQLQNPLRTLVPYAFKFRKLVLQR